jgi:modification methylase
VRAFPLPRHRNLAILPTNLLLCGQESLERQRADRYTGASIRAHPGKMRPALARTLIERYTKPDDWILDPLSGIGTTGVEAVHLGRNYVGIELEPRFVTLQRQNLKRARKHGASGMGTVYQGDAQRLDGWNRSLKTSLSEDGPVDAIITSPPYGGRLKSERGPRSKLLCQWIEEGRVPATLIPASYGIGPQNLGNLRGARYLEGMRQVYRGCYQCLRSGGLMLLVLQPDREQQHLRPLHHETATLCQDLGFELLDELVAVLGRIVASPGQPARLTTHTSFWRRLAVAHLREAGHPVTLCQLEYVLVFRKPPVEPARHLTPKAKSGRQAALAGPGVRSG